MLSIEKVLSKNGGFDIYSSRSLLRIIELNFFNTKDLFLFDMIYWWGGVLDFYFGKRLFMNTITKVFTFIFSVLFICTAFSVYWFGPWSPNLEHRARKLIVSGELEEGVDLMLWKAEHAFSEEQRHDALWGAARLVALKSDSLMWSKELLYRCLEEKNFSQKAEVHAQLAAILFEDQPRAAIEHWQWAIYYGYQTEKAEQWRVRLAMALEGEGNIEAAIDIWEESTGFRSSARVAHMALGRIYLKDNPEISLHHFQQAQELAGVDRERPATIGSQIARLELGFID